VKQIDPKKKGGATVTDQGGSDKKVVSLPGVEMGARELSYLL
jgi:hypothetical protein